MGSGVSLLHAIINLINEDETEQLGKMIAAQPSTYFRELRDLLILLVENKFNKNVFVCETNLELPDHLAKVQDIKLSTRKMVNEVMGFELSESVEPRLSLMKSIKMQ